MGWGIFLSFKKWHTYMPQCASKDWRTFRVRVFPIISSERALKSQTKSMLADSSLTYNYLSQNQDYLLCSKKTSQVKRVPLLSYDDSKFNAKKVIFTSSINCKKWNQVLHKTVLEKRLSTTGRPSGNNATVFY